MPKGVFRKYYKGHMDKTKREGGSRRRRHVWLGWGIKLGRKRKYHNICYATSHLNEVPSTYIKNRAYCNVNQPFVGPKVGSPV